MEERDKMLGKDLVCEDQQKMTLAHSHSAHVRTLAFT